MFKMGKRARGDKGVEEVMRTSRNWGEGSRLRKMVGAIKDVPCADCGGRFHYCAMDFDHRPGERKIQNIGIMVTNSLYAVEDIMEEIAKCDIVCSNCHRLRTFMRRKASKGK